MKEYLDQFYISMHLVRQVYMQKYLFKIISNFFFKTGIELFYIDFN